MLVIAVSCRHWPKSPSLSIPQQPETKQQMSGAKGRNCASTYYRKMTCQGEKNHPPGKTVQDSAVFLFLAFPQPLWKHKEIQQNSNQATLGTLWNLCSFQQAEQLAQNKRLPLTCAKWQEYLEKANGIAADRQFFNWFICLTHNGCNTFLKGAKFRQG